MIAITNTSQLIRFRLGLAHATSPVRVFFTGRNITATNIAPINLGVNSNGTSNVTLVSSPLINEQKELQSATFFNADTIQQTITIEYFDGATAFTLFQTTLAPNEILEYKNGWRVFATSGAIKQSINQGANAPNSSQSAVILASDVVNNNAVANTMQDVTGLSASFLANKAYWFKFVIPYECQATTTGSRWSVNASAGLPTRLQYKSEYTLSTVSVTNNPCLQVFDSPNTANAQSGSLLNNLAIIEGYFTPTADCTFIARFASEIAGSAITAKAGAVMYYQQTT